MTTMKCPRCKGRGYRGLPNMEFIQSDKVPCGHRRWRTVRQYWRCPNCNKICGWDMDNKKWDEGTYEM